MCINNVQHENIGILVCSLIPEALFVERGGVHVICMGNGNMEGLETQGPVFNS